MIITKAVLSNTKKNEKFFNDLKNECDLLQIKVSVVIDYFIRKVEGKKTGNVKSKKGKSRQQAKIANRTDLKDLLAVGEKDDEDIIRIKNKDRLLSILLKNLLFPVQF